MSLRRYIMKTFSMCILYFFCIGYSVAVFSTFTNMSLLVLWAEENLKMSFCWERCEGRSWSCWGSLGCWHSCWCFDSGYVAQWLFYEASMTKTCFVRIMWIRHRVLLKANRPRHCLRKMTRPLMLVVPQTVPVVEDVHLLYLLCIPDHHNRWR